MAKRGQKSKPIALRALEGDPKLDDRKVVKIETAAPSRPSWLTGYASETWERLAPALHRIGLLTEFDRDIFAIYCSLMAAYRDAAMAGSIFKMCRIGAQLRIAGSEFGLSPAARAGLGIDAATRRPGGPKTGAAKLLGGK